MRIDGIRAKTVKRWRATTQSNHRWPVAENILNRQFTVAHPTRVWAGNCIDVRTTAGWLSLAVILDLYSRRVIGWAMRHRLTVELAEQEPTGGLLHHSDRGSQYAATRYQLVLPPHGITTSMSRNGNCGDNAWVERFFGTLKRERVSPRHDATRDDAKREIVEYREVVSNRPRRHSTLGDHSPAEYATRTAVA